MPILGPYCHFTRLSSAIVGHGPSWPDMRQPPSEGGYHRSHMRTYRHINAQIIHFQKSNLFCGPIAVRFTKVAIHQT